MSRRWYIPFPRLRLSHIVTLAVLRTVWRPNTATVQSRFDDTNPTKETDEFVQSIIDDVAWLGAKWDDRLLFTSDYFEQFYEFAVQLVEKGKAYVCDLTQEEMREYRGTLTAPGKDIPWRNRSVDEHLDLLERMRKGEFPNGSRTLRAKIDWRRPT